jgi:hypothetical protein
VSYYFAKNNNGKSYVVTAKEKGKIVYSSYKQPYAKGGEISQKELNKYLSSHSEMFNDNAQTITKKDVINVINLSKNSDKKYWVKDMNTRYSYYIFKGNLRLNNGTGGIFSTSITSSNTLKDEHKFKIKEKDLYDWEKELDPNKERVGWESIIYKFGEVYYSEGTNNNELVSDQVKAEEYKWQFDRYSKYASSLSWADAEDKFKKSLTADELNSIEISYSKEEYADLEEHDTEKYHKQIVVKLKKYEKGGSTYQGGGDIKTLKVGDRIKDKYGYELEVYQVENNKIHAQAPSGSTHTYYQKDFDNGEVELFWSNKTYQGGGEMSFGWAKKYLDDANEYKKLSWYIMMGKGVEKTIDQSDYILFNDGSALKYNEEVSEWQFTSPKRIDKNSGKGVYQGGGEITDYVNGEIVKVNDGGYGEIVYLDYDEDKVSIKHQDDFYKDVIREYDVSEVSKKGGSTYAEGGNTYRKEFDELFEMFPDNWKDATDIWKTYSAKKKEEFRRDLGGQDAASEGLVDYWDYFVKAKSEQDMWDNYPDNEDYAKGGVIGVKTPPSFKPADLENALKKAKIKGYSMNRLSTTLIVLKVDGKDINDTKKIIDDLGLSVMMKKGGEIDMKAEKIKEIEELKEFLKTSTDEEDIEQAKLSIEELENEIMYNYAEGGALSKEFKFDKNFVIYVPSTSDVGNKISQKELDKRVDEVEKYVANEFGGYTETDTDGGYKSTSGDIIEEDIVKVSVFANNKDWKKNESKIVSKVKGWATKWGQEAIGFEYEGDLYYIDEAGKFAKGGTIKKGDYV